MIEITVLGKRPWVKAYTVYRFRIVAKTAHYFKGAKA